MLTVHGLLSLLILNIRHVNADGQLYVYILCAFLLTMPVNLLINLSEPFFDTTVGPRPNLARAQIWHACVDRDETGSQQRKLTNPTPEGFRGCLLMFVGGMFVGGMWHDSSRW